MGYRWLNMEDLKMIEEGQGVEGETGAGQGAGEGGQELEADRDQETEEENDQGVAGERSLAQDVGTGQDHEIRANLDQHQRTGLSPNLEVNLCREINPCLGKSQDHGISPGPDRGTRSRDHVTISQDRGTRSRYHGINQDQLINPSPDPDPGQVVVTTN